MPGMRGTRHRFRVRLQQEQRIDPRLAALQDLINKNQADEAD